MFSLINIEVLLIADNEGIKLPLLSSVKPSNDQHKSWAIRRLLAKFSDISGKKIRN